MPLRLTPEQAQAKWVQRLSGATAEIQAGVQRVQQAPGAKAAAKRTKWRQNVQAAEEKWARKVGAVTLADWQNLTINVGVPRVAAGAQAKQDKFGNFARRFFPVLQQVVARADQMPDTSFEERVQKSVFVMRELRNFGQTGGTAGGGA